MITNRPARRYWQEVTVEESTGGWQVKLDDREIRTPASRLLVLPTFKLAELIANEWRLQTDFIFHGSMPMTHLAMGAMDMFPHQRALIIQKISGYGETDLVCYRAAGVPILRRRQDEGWQPLIDWIRSKFGVDMLVTEGIMPIRQPERTILAFQRTVGMQPDFQLASLQEVVTLLGSLVLGLAVIEGVLNPEQAWNLSRIDEDWQIGEWGKDEELTFAAGKKREFYLRAFEFFTASIIP